MATTSNTLDPNSNVRLYPWIELPKAEPCPTGTEYDEVYFETVDDDGVKCLKLDRMSNRYEKIQECLPETLIYNILDRYFKGDESILDQTSGLYADVSTAPKSLIEAYQRIEDIENNFENLPVDLRAEFNHSVTEFIARMATGDGLQTVEQYIKDKNIKKTPTESTQTTPVSSEAGDGGDTE